MQFQDYYKTLGVSRTASDDEIKRAYRKLAKEWHPDRHPESERETVEKKFKAIAEANEVLSDPEKRKRYDALGENWRQGQDFRGGPGGGFQGVDPEEFARMFGGRAGMGGGGGGGGFSDFFAQMFGDMFAGGGRGGARRQQRAPQRGADAEAEIELSVGEALLGGKRSFAFRMRVPCEVCGGEGRLSTGACPACGGLGASNQQKTIELKIPDDVRDGRVLRLRGLGEPGEQGAQAGDLLLTLRVVSDATYRVDGSDLEVDVEVAPWDAFVGTKADVRTPRGVASLKIPAETRAGAKLRLRGQGLGKPGGERGDLIAVVRFALPAELSERQRALLRELAERGEGAVS